jgi:hypothetical protein
MSTNEQSVPPHVASYKTAQAKRRVAVVWVCAAVVGMAAVLFVFDPMHTSFYPTCVFKKATGWSCPACGCLRASHELVHGHLAKAFRFNPLLIASAPLLLVLGAQEFLPQRIIKKPAYLGWTLLVLFVVFGVMRNLPPFLGWSAQ